MIIRQQLGFCSQLFTYSHSEMIRLYGNTHSANMDPCAALLLIINFYLFTSTLLFLKRWQIKKVNQVTLATIKWHFKQKYEGGTRTTIKCYFVLTFGSSGSFWHDTRVNSKSYFSSTILVLDWTDSRDPALKLEEVCLVDLLQVLRGSSLRCLPLSHPDRRRRSEVKTAV